MRGYRFSIGGICAVVVVFGVGLAALRNPTTIWEGVFALLFRSLLALGFVGAICAPKESRASWVAFFGFGYAYVFFDIDYNDLGFLSILLSKVIYMISGIDPRTGKLVLSGVMIQRAGHFDMTARNFIALIYASIGAAASHFLFGRKRDESPKSVPDVGTGRPAWPIPRTLIVLAGFGGLAYLALLVSRWFPATCVALVVYSAWAVVILLGVGVVFGRGRRRAACLGAALFGWGYLLSISIHYPNGWEAWPEVATHAFMAKVRPWLPGSFTKIPSVTNPVAASNVRIEAILNRPATIEFPQETPLEDFLKEVNKAFLEADGLPVNFYVDPVGLQEAEKTESSPVIISLKNIRLGTILELALKQIGLTYNIRDGLIVVTSESSADIMYPMLAEPRAPYFQIGHCFLAMCAAALGAILAPRVYDRVTA